MKTCLNHEDNNYVLEVVCSNIYRNKNQYKLILYSRNKYRIFKSLSLSAVIFREEFESSPEESLV